MWTVLFVYSVTCVTMCYSLQHGWKGSVKIVDGIPHVFNPRTPANVGPALKFQKVLEIGGEAATKEQVLVRIIGIEVSKEGNIYVLDGNACNVRVFSPSKQLLRTIGRKGGGPSEFETPIALALSNESILVVAQSIPASLAFFDREGTFLSRISLKGQGVMLGIQALSNEQFLISSVSTEFKNNEVFQKYSLSSVTNTGKTTSEIFTMLRRRSVNRQTVSETEAYWPAWCADQNENIYVAEDLYQYKLKVFNREGKLLKIIEREFKPIERTTRELKELTDALELKKKQLGIRGVEYEFSREKPIINSIFVDEVNNVWVATPEGASDEQTAFDIFDTSGQYIEKAIIGARSNGNFLIRNGHIYFSHQGVESFPTIYVFKIVERR